MVPYLTIDLASWETDPELYLTKAAKVLKQKALAHLLTIINLVLYLRLQLRKVPRWKE